MGSPPQPPRGDPKSKAKGFSLARTSGDAGHDDDPTPRQSAFLPSRDPTPSALTPRSRPIDDDPTPRQSDFHPSRNTPTPRSSSAGQLTPGPTTSPPTATPGTHRASMPSLLATAPLPIEGLSDLAFRDREGYGGGTGTVTMHVTGVGAVGAVVSAGASRRGRGGRRSVGADGGGEWQGGPAVLAVRGAGAVQQTVGADGASSVAGQGNGAPGQQGTQQGHASPGGQGMIPVRDSLSLAKREKLTEMARQANQLMEERERNEQGGYKNKGGGENGGGKRERGV